MTQLSPAQVAAYARGAGFTGSALVWAVAVALAESSGNTAATHTNSDGSIDRGLWQINSKYHPEVSAAAAFDPAQAAAAAYRISNGGKSFTQWSTAKSGAASRQLSTAQLAASTGASTGTGTTASGYTAQNADLTSQGAVGLGTLLGQWLGEQATGGNGPVSQGLSDAGQLAGAAAATTPGASVVASLDTLAKSAATLVSSELSLAQWLAQPHSWSRIGLVVLGGGAALAGLVMLGQTGIGGPVGAVARPAGRAAAAAGNTAKTGAKAALSAGAAVATDGASLAGQAGAAAAKGVGKAGAAAGKAAAAAGK